MWLKSLTFKQNLIFNIRFQYQMLKYFPTKLKYRYQEFKFMSYHIGFFKAIKIEILVQYDLLKYRLKK